MRSKRKTTLLLGFSILASSALYADQSVAFELAADQVKGDITFYTNRTDLVEAGVYDEYTKHFKQKYPNVGKVNVVGLADYQGSMRPRMNTGDYGDLVLVLPSVPKDQYDKFYEPLDMYAPEQVRFYDTWKHGDVAYGLSMGNAIEGLVYNKQVLAEANVSLPIKTLDELYQAAANIAKNGNVPFYVNFGAQWPLQYWDKYPVTIAGTNHVYENMLTTKNVFSTQGSPYRQSLTVLKTLIENKWTESDLMTNSWEESKSVLADGKAGMFYIGSWFIPQVIDRGISSDELGFMPMPVDNQGTLRAQMNSDWGYAISKFSKNKVTAKAYLMYLLEETDFEARNGFIPTIRSKKTQLAQVDELLSYGTTIIEGKSSSADFIAVTNRAKIDFYSGGYIQNLMTAESFEDALKLLDKRWERAKKRVLR